MSRQLLLAKNIYEIEQEEDPRLHDVPKIEKKGGMVVHSQDTLFRVQVRAYGCLRNFECISSSITS